MKQISKLLLVSLAILFVQTNLYAQVNRVDAIGITVKDMNRSVKFYQDVLGFKKISDNEFSGKEYENLEGIFGLKDRKSTRLNSSHQ